MAAVMARIALSSVWLVCACQGCPSQRRALRASFFVGGSTLTVLAEPGRGVRLGFRAGTCGQRLKTSLASICVTQERAETTLHRHACIVRAVVCGKLRPEQTFIQPSAWTTIEYRK
jgi:hypothetical protein